MRLSVFRGGATAEAARQVTGATVEVLAGLVDQALLRRLTNGRYEIHELLRQFAAEQLAVAVGSPLLCVDRIAFTYGDKPVEWRRGLCLTDGYSYYNELA